MTRSGMVFVVTTAAALAVTLAFTFWSSPLLRIARRLASRLPERWALGLIRVVEAALSGLRSLRDWRFGAIIWLLSAAILIVSITTNYIVFKTLGLSLGPVAALFLTVVLRIGQAPPSLPGKIGLFQYLVVVALAAFGIDRTTALSYSFVLYAIAVLPVLVAFRWTSVDRESVSHPAAGHPLPASGERDRA